MKSAIRAILINTGALWLAAQAASGISYQNDFRILLFASLALAVINTLVKPLVKIVALPINFLTLGAFSWLINALMLYLVTVIVPGFSVSAFDFPGYTWKGFVIPAAQFNDFWAFVVVSLLISFIGNFLSWLCN